MRPNRIIFFLLLSIAVLKSAGIAYGQTGISFNIKKPKQFEDRPLRSEKSGEKKFTLPRRFIQNTTTHYNYFFNANNKLNEVLSQAKLAYKDDYSELLSFYNYTLDATAQNKNELDSIIHKATTGIVLHDLRNDWIDNMFLLWGAAYYLRKDFDSAYLTFQYINYSFAPKEKDGYYKNIGSRMDGNNAFSIASREKMNLLQKAFTTPPSRNDAFVWQVRTLLARDEFAEAASLIDVLHKDPAFPSRLRNDLEEVQALLFYKQNMYDSSATHLTKALSNAPTKLERARWEYLAAQLFELSGKYASASELYADAIKHTTDPVMDVYARLGTIRVRKDDTENYIEKNIEELVKMARKDRYFDYKDIIYYTAALMELERNNMGGAQELLLKAAAANTGNEAQRNKAFLKLSDMAYAHRDYPQAYSFLDSVKLSDPTLKDPEKLQARKEMLGRIAEQYSVVFRQDSLQKIAAMPEEERKAFVRKIVRELRKQQGLKPEEDGRTPTGGINAASKSGGDLFSGTPAKGEWYFYNASAKTKGMQDFRSRWGNRPNVDNWRRIAQVRNSGAVKLGGDLSATTNKGGGATGVSFDALYENLPVTEEKKVLSDDSLLTGLYKLGKLYLNEVEDCSAMTESFERIRTQFPGFEKMDDVLFSLHYCYAKNGDKLKAAEIKKEMSEKHGASNFTSIVLTGKDSSNKKGNTEATRRYEAIYDLFIEGKFEEALKEKKNADSVYGKNYWSPQLLYIESVYYIKQRQDSLAQPVLESIIADYPTSPLALKAENLLKVLARRSQIEEELRNLKVERPAEPAPVVNNPSPVVSNPPVVTTNPAPVTQPVNNPPAAVPPKPATPDTAKNKPPVVPSVPTGSYIFNAADSYMVMIILNKVDVVFRNEAKNAFFRYNTEKYYNKKLEIVVEDIDADNRVLLVKGFANAQEAADYITRVRPAAPAEIVPWLKGDKYSFSAISPANLELLKTAKDIPAYKQLLERNLPGKF